MTSALLHAAPAAAQPRWVLPDGAPTAREVARAFLLLPAALFAPAESVAVDVEPPRSVGVWQESAAAPCTGARDDHRADTTTVAVRWTGAASGDTILRVCIDPRESGSFRLVAAVTRTRRTGAPRPRIAPASVRRTIVVSDELSAVRHGILPAIDTTLLTAGAGAVFTMLVFFAQETWKRRAQRQDDDASARRERLGKVAELYRLFVGEVLKEIAENSRRLRGFVDGSGAPPPVDVAGNRALETGPDLRALLGEGGPGEIWPATMSIYAETSRYRDARERFLVANREGRADDAALALAESRRIATALLERSEGWLADPKTSKVPGVIG